jgi:putative transposase
VSYQLVEQLHKKAIPVVASCDALEVSRSGYYAWRQRVSKPLCCKQMVHLKAAFAVSQRSYGSRRMVTAMANSGIAIGRYRVRRMMREAALIPVWKRKFVHTTNSNHDLPIAQNVLARQFNPSKPNLAYVSEIVCTQMTKTNVFAVWGRRNDIPDFNVVVCNDNAVD